MDVIVLAAQKGGAGKTTLAAGIAVAATQDGRRVVCLDADPQGSLSAWGVRREAGDILFRRVEAREVDGLVARIESHGKHDLVVVDSPGTFTPAVTMLLNQATLCVVPVKPSILDVEATAPTVRALGFLERRFVYVLSQANAAMAGRTEEARTLLSESGPVAPGSIGSRAAHLDSMITGQGVTEIGGRAGQEMSELWAWIKKTMKGQ